MKKSCDLTSHPPLSFLVLVGKIERLNRIKKELLRQFHDIPEISKQKPGASLTMPAIPNQMINDDRFVIHTMESSWKFGADATGNICEGVNLECLINEMGPGDIDLVTADGSVDCQV